MQCVASSAAALVRYSIAGNFLGLPAITVPVRAQLLPRSTCRSIYGIIVQDWIGITQV
jgi:hypothetical protein